MTAALSVGPAARPLPLFYALSQSTRAICAVHLEDDFLIRKHGLSWPGAHGTEKTLMHREVKPNPSTTGAFSRLCAALRCDSLRSAVAVGALWRALPDLGQPDLPHREPGWFNAMQIGELPHERRINREPEWMEIYAGPCDGAGMNVVEWTRRLERYPSLAGWSPTPFETAPEQATYTSWGNPPAQVLVLRRAIGETATPTWVHVALSGLPYAGSEHRFAIPALPRGENLAPLALWWAVLFALCSLARYEPDSWVKTLNVDRNRLAVPLEDCLAEAIDVLPHHILEALLRRSVPTLSYPDRPIDGE